MEFNNAFFEELGKSQGVTDLVRAAAERVAQQARESAPVDSGDYKRGIKVEMKYQRRAVGLVVGTDPKTMLVESKTGNLARALQASKRRG